MMEPSINARELALRSAIENGQLVRAEDEFKAYIAWFQSGPRTLEEVESARDLLGWAIGAVKAQSAQVAEELARLIKVADGYGPARRLHTWQLQG
jgi:hypothetical protein